MKEFILVIAPRFPSINQPWIDTYLEQLRKNGFDFSIYSSNPNNTVYDRKIDALRLRERFTDFSFDGRGWLVEAVAGALKRPIRAITCVNRARIKSRLFAERGVSRLVSFIKLFAFGMIVERFGPLTVCHGHEEIATFQFLHLTLMRDIPMVMTFHGLPPADVGQLSFSKRRLLFSVVETVIVNTRFARDQVISLGCTENKIRVLPQGLPLEEYPYEREKAEPKAVLRILTVARFHRDKGHAYCLLAMRRLLDRGIAFHYQIVGVGPERDRIGDLIRKLNLDRYVTINEGISVTELRSLYRDSDIFILASVNNSRGHHVETQGVVLQEAQATGCIPIATRVGGIPECVEDDVDAILVGDRSSRAIAEAVMYLNNNRQRWVGFQRKGRENVEQNFSADGVGEKMARVLKSVSGNSSLSAPH